MTDVAVEGGFGIYLHWPFCAAKCPYCDFNSHVSASIDQSEWCSAYLAEIDRLYATHGDRILNSVFFGGGTPSLMDAQTIDAILERITSRWRLANDLEVTLEANPSSVEANKFRDFRAAGVNRVSLGVQALNDTDLKRLGRLHSAKEALHAMDIARSNFDRASFDLIYARQEQTLDSWAMELDQALALGFTHFSLYQLTIEDGTAFGDRFAAGKLRGLPADDDAADMYDYTLERCEAAGMPRYEVSNFAVPGEESRHNLIYWRYGEYAGIGPGAHGRLLDEAGNRFATETALAPAKWLKDVKDGSGQANRTALPTKDQATEMVMMGLRLREGLALRRLEAFKEPILDQVELVELESSGAVSVRNGVLVVEKQYVSVLNTVTEKLLAG